VPLEVKGERMLGQEAGRGRKDGDSSQEKKHSPQHSKELSTFQAGIQIQYMHK